MKIAITALLLSILSASFADDLSQLYEKAYFLETAKGQTKEALELYEQIVSADATDANRHTVIQSLERMLVLHKRQCDKTFQDKVDHFQMEPDILKQIIDRFGEPLSYVNDDRVYERDALPATGYTLSYPGGFSIRISTGKIFELTFKEPNFSVKGIGVGSSLVEVISTFPPDKTIAEAGHTPRTDKGVLFSNFGIDGTHSYNTKEGIRLFLIKNKVSCLYINKDFHPTKL